MASGPIFAEKTVLNSSNVIYPEWFLKFPGKLYYRRYPIIKLTRQRIGTQSNNPHPVSSTTFRILYNLPKIQAHAAKCQPRGKEQKIGHGQFLLDHPLARLRSQSFPDPGTYAWAMRITLPINKIILKRTHFSPLTTLALTSKVLLQRLSSFSGTATAVRTVLKADERGELLDSDASLGLVGTVEEAEAMNEGRSSETVIQS